MELITCICEYCKHSIPLSLAQSNQIKSGEIPIPTLCYQCTADTDRTIMEDQED